MRGSFGGPSAAPDLPIRAGVRGHTERAAGWWKAYAEPAICRRSAIVTGVRQSWRSAPCTFAPKVSQNVRETGQRQCHRTPA
jgi:hypothetical protein